jgi:hypothetical protein
MAAAIVMAVAPAQGQQTPANSLRELQSALIACMNRPPGPVGSQLTIVFALKRDGSLLGKPRISQARLTGTPSDQRNFVAGAIAAFGRCLPARITDGLGGAIAGRILSVRLVVHPPETAA